MKDLAERAKETVHLVFLDRNEIVYIDKVETDQNPSGLKMASRVGLRNPAHSCAVGKVLLAHFTEEELKSFIKEKNLVKRTENTIIDPIHSPRFDLYVREYFQLRARRAGHQVAQVKASYVATQPVPAARVRPMVRYVERDPVDVEQFVFLEHVEDDPYRPVIGVVAEQEGVHIALLAGG